MAGMHPTEKETTMKTGTDKWKAAVVRAIGKHPLQRSRKEQELVSQAVLIMAEENLAKHGEPLTWCYRYPADDTVDPVWEAFEARFEIQDCRAYGGNFVLNEYSGEDETLCVTHHGEFAHLYGAKFAAEKLRRGRA
jgi:hypothetical protein